MAGMKMISSDPFSNGTEYMMWEENNCDKCIKSSRYDEKKDHYSKVRCAVQRDIFKWMIGNEPISQRSYDACQKWNCPYRKEEWPKRKRKYGVKQKETLF